MVHVIRGSNARRTDERQSERTSLAARAAEAAAAAARHADDVDRTARFPQEAFDALRRERLLGVLAPAEFGGEGVSISEMLEVCYVLGQACSATAMIYAMHQTMVACLVRFGRGNLWQEGMLRRLVRDQLLIASSTTEGSKGGDLRSSEAAVERDGPKIRLERLASCISYGEHADCIVTTARRSPDSAPTQQVLIALPKECYVLEKRHVWDTLGMRGTCSSGFLLKAEGLPEQILSESFDRINARCMMPVAHLAWAAAWAGVAAAALGRARRFLLQSMRNSNGKTPPALTRLTGAANTLETLRCRIVATSKRFEDASSDDQALDSIEFQTSMNLLKVEASELALDIVVAAMRICGLSGYRNDTEFSVGRHLRDLFSSPIMINNDRIAANMASHALICAVPEGLGASF
jgi:acyl-CoA dehydrogenase